MRLHPVRGADDQHGCVQNAEGPFGLPGKIGMAGRVQERQVRMVPGEAGFPGEDGDAAVLFHRIGIQEGVAVIHPALATNGAGKEEHGFGERGLARVHMGAESDDRSFRHSAASFPRT